MQPDHSEVSVGSTYSVCQRRQDSAVKYFVAILLSSVLRNRRQSEVKLDFWVKDLPRFSFFRWTSNSEGLDFRLPPGHDCVVSPSPCLKCVCALWGGCFVTFLTSLAVFGASYKSFPWLRFLIFLHGPQPVLTIREFTGGMFFWRPQPLLCPVVFPCTTLAPHLFHSISSYCDLANPSSLLSPTMGIRLPCVPIHWYCRFLTRIVPPSLQFPMTLSLVVEVACSGAKPLRLFSWQWLSALQQKTTGHFTPLFPYFTKEIRLFSLLLKSV